MINRLQEENRRVKEFMRGDFADQLWTGSVAFSILLVVGFLLGMFLTDFADHFLAFFTQSITDGGVVDDQGRVHLLPLLVNNLRASVVTVLYGMIPFIYLPALSLGINSFLLGFFAAYYVRNGMSMLYYLAAIVPHGIFELPALVLSISLGLYLCKHVNHYIQHNTKGELKEVFLQILRVLLLRAFPLFVVASAVECFVTPWIIRLF